MHLIGETLASAAKFLATAGIDSPRADAELILAAILQVRRERLLSTDRDPISEPDLHRFNRWIARRGEKREPVAYITGHVEFYGLPLRVSPSVLVPRPETELLVERALAIIAGRPLRVADIGTGSGAIAVAIAANSPAKVVATDRSVRALEIAKSNARPGMEFRAGDLFAPLGGEPVDLVCSNPPYVARKDLAGLPAEVKHEPVSALDGGEDGLDVVRRIAAEAPRATLLVEIGAGQAAAAREIFYRAGFADVVFHRDLASIERVLEARRPSP